MIFGVCCCNLKTMTACMTTCPFWIVGKTNSSFRLVSKTSSQFQVSGRMQSPFHAGSEIAVKRNEAKLKFKVKQQAVKHGP